MRVPCRQPVPAGMTPEGDGMYSPAAESQGSAAITVLSIAPLGEDHVRLKEILTNSSGAPLPDGMWRVEPSFTPRAAMERLRAARIPIVLCANDHQPEAWKEMLDLLAGLPDAPCMVVTSRQADDRLWVEALNLGAYDVLAKPFDRSEVLRTLANAWQHWSTRHQRKCAAA
jgi:DNA-binding NtrC family response regulator